MLAMPLKRKKVTNLPYRERSPTLGEVRKTKARRISQAKTFLKGPLDDRLAEEKPPTAMVPTRTANAEDTHIVPPATPAALYKMITIPEAQKTVLRVTKEAQIIRVPLHKAAGYTLAADVVAKDNLPPFPASIKDGYAVRFADGSGDFTVEFEAMAGTAPRMLSSGMVAYIGTGGPVPEGADAVVQIENTVLLPPTEDGGARIRIVKPAAAVGEDIRQVGSDIRQGDVVLACGERILEAEVGLLATVGAATVKVYKKPKVGVLSTGDEVVDPGTDVLGPGQIRDANRSMLLQAAASAGAEIVDLGIARDTPGDVEGSFAAAMAEGVDVLITSGGVSMGDKDLVKPILERKGHVHFGKVKMKPGKPLTFATMERPSGSGGQVLLFGLPGNPVSSLVTFNLVVRPALQKMAGWEEPGLRRVHARTTQAIKLDPERPEYHRVTLEWSKLPDREGGEFLAFSTGGQISSRLLSMRAANALLELPQEKGLLQAGSVVTALVIGDIQGMPKREIESSQRMLHQ